MVGDGSYIATTFSSSAPFFVALDQRIALRVHLDGMDLDETGTYIRHDLNLAGRTDNRRLQGYSGTARAGYGHKRVSIRAYNLDEFTSRFNRRGSRARGPALLPAPPLSAAH